MRTIEVTGLAHIGGGRAVVSELSIGTMRRLRRDLADPEERGLAMVAAALVEPVMTPAQIDEMPVSAMADLNRLVGAVQDLNTPEGAATDPPA